MLLQNKRQANPTGWTAGTPHLFGKASYISFSTPCVPFDGFYFEIYRKQSYFICVSWRWCVNEHRQRTHSHSSSGLYFEQVWNAEILTQKNGREAIGRRGCSDSGDILASIWRYGFRESLCYLGSVWILLGCKLIEILEIISGHFNFSHYGRK